MGSNANNINDATTFQPSEPAPCANGCGFFGTAATNGFCSKCFRDIRVTAENAAEAKAAVHKLVNQVVTLPQPPSSSSSGSEPVPPPAAVAAVELTQKLPNRCVTCSKKVGVMGFKCRCGDTFCGSHRYPEKHDCEFDFKKTGRDEIAKANPVIRADKMDRI